MNLQTGDIDDNVISNNGDSEKVLEAVSKANRQFFSFNQFLFLNFALDFINSLKGSYIG